MDTINIIYYKKELYNLILGSYQNKLCLVDHYYRKNRESFDNKLQDTLGAIYCEKTDPILDTTIHQLNEYFNQTRKSFTIPLLLIGTTFQKKVWNELLSIPYGQKKSYKELAQNLNIKNSFRAIGNANGMNPISIIIPCHRVIRSDGSLGGYAGGIDTKLNLLSLEND